MPAVTYKSTHVAEAIARLTSKYKDKPKTLALLTAIAEQVQLFEDAVLGPLGVRESQTLEGAFAIGGEPLDALGDLVGQERGGLDDESFLRHIRARIRVNRSQGLPEDAYKITRALFPDRDAFTVTYKSWPPAAFTVTIGLGLVTIFEAADLQELLQEGAKAGVRVGVRFSTAAPEDTFSFEGGPGLGFDEGLWAGSF